MDGYRCREWDVSRTLFQHTSYVTHMSMHQLSHLSSNRATKKLWITPWTSVFVCYDVLMDLPARYNDMLSAQRRKERKLNPRQVLCMQIVAELEIEPGKARGIFFSILTDKELRELWQTSRSWKVNPRALFWKQYHQKVKQVKEFLDYIPGVDNSVDDRAGRSTI